MRFSLVKNRRQFNYSKSRRIDSSRPRLECVLFFFPFSTFCFVLENEWRCSVCCTSRRQVFSFSTCYQAAIATLHTHTQWWNPSLAQIQQTQREKKKDLENVSHTTLKTTHTRHFYSFLFFTCLNTYKNQLHFVCVCVSSSLPVPDNLLTAVLRRGFLLCSGGDI